MTLTLQRRLETLYGLERRKDKLGLDGTRALLAALGNPHERFRSVHVAGTNGKGSVCALIERVLREAGYRTGLYTSPHLVDFRERIRVNGRWADEDWLEQALDRIEALPEGKDRTFFEVATALGFLYFAEREVEIAVVEVGLGGRLDCTNVITPEVSVITSIGLDHTEILGDTIEAIAFEKAGIVKPGVPVVLPQGNVAAAEVVRQVAEVRGAPITAFVTPDVEAAAEPDPDEAEPWETETLAARAEEPGLVQGRAASSPRNQAAALAALQALALRGFSITSLAVTRGFRAARWPGRMERCPTEPRLWWDGAHNPAGIRHLESAWWAAHGPSPPAVVVLALSRDKDARAMIAELCAAFTPLRLVVTRSLSGRAAEPEALAREAMAQGVPVVAAPDLVAALALALRSAEGGAVLLPSSLFAIGEAMELFGGAPGEQL